MSPREQILKDALTLPPADQAFVALGLEDSLARLIADESTESDGTNPADLLRELQRRSLGYRDGSSTARDADSVLNDLRSRQSRESLP
jgi:hypothetical protein